MSNELAHFGILGMKWGVRRYQNSDGSYTSAGKKRYNKDRKTKLLESVEEKKAHVDSMRKQAGERIQFYGGKNVALNAIDKEASYKKSATTAKTAAAGTLISTGAFFATAFASSSVPVAAVSAATVAAGAAFVGAMKNIKISQIAKEQKAYTKDSDYGPDVVVKKSRD